MSMRYCCFCCKIDDEERVPIISQPRGLAGKRFLKYENDLRNRENEITRLTFEVSTLKSRNEELLLRLSASASAKLTDGNPNIADLNDENRPTKLAEQFLELYDNQWTDAFETLRKDEQRTEYDACKLLLDVLISIYSACHKKSEEDLRKITETLKEVYKMDERSTEVMRTFKGDRKKNCSTSIQEREQEIQDMLRNKLTDEESILMNAYIKAATRICWLMAIQDPPVYIDPLVDLHKSRFDSTKYHPYTQSGDDVDFIVWPVLYLYKGGNVLSKGVAQGIKMVE